LIGHKYFIKIAGMKARLTLSIKKSLLAKARKLSLKSKKSISRMFEEYIEESILKSPTPITDPLRGILKKWAGNKTYDELKREAMKEKYGI
jgi:hypothetical protein